MENKIKIGKDSKVIVILKALLASYVITGGLLLLLALLLYKCELSESFVKIGIIVIYTVSTMSGGILAGKMIRVQKFLWGLVVGILYFTLLLLVSLGIYRTVQGNMTHIMTTFLICAGGGMLGGMIS